MSCPECGKHTRQEWSDGCPAVYAPYYSPAEEAGYECGWCGYTYGSKWDRVDAAADAKYDERRDEE